MSLQHSLICGRPVEFDGKIPGERLKTARGWAGAIFPAGWNRPLLVDPVRQPGAFDRRIRENTVFGKSSEEDNR
ncbi:hypothetical protein N7535_001906 [Penicillium sp. DV-2018c]|nr:hypothetical protein N7535_001906 [Penicillium sp. DV-2018c]